MARLDAQLAELGDAFTVATARTVGIHPNQLYRAKLERPVQGIFLNPVRPPTEPEHPQAERTQLHRSIAMALASELSPHFFFCHETVAARWGLPIRLRDVVPLKIASHSPNHHVRRRGVHSSVFTTSLAQVVRSRRLSLTSPASTWAILAPRLSTWDAVALGDAVIRKSRIGGTQRCDRPPLATVEEIFQAIHVPQRVARQRLMQLASLLSPHSASPPETHLRLLLADLGFSPEELDYDIWDAQGNFVGCSEIAYPSRKVLFEYEGDHHRTDARQWNRDLQKHADYDALGWRVVRVTASMLYRDQSGLRRRIMALLG